MIRAELDLARLAAQVGGPLRLEADGTIRAGGVRITAADADDLHVEPDMAVVLRGRPHATSEPLAGALALAPARALAAGLRADPAALLNQLHGRFSLLWVDAAKGTCGFATDRFATHSLCHGSVDGRLVVAERADAVDPDAELDPQAIFNYLHFHCIPAPLTVFRDVRRLEQGCMWRGGTEGGEAKPWWQPTFVEVGRPDFSALRDQFRRIIRDAVARDLGTGKVAAFLSGGTDSSTVVGMMREVTGEAPRSYSIGFDAQGYDEMEYARIAAKRFGADHREHYVTPADLVANIPLVATHYDQPFGNSSALPAYCLARLARADGYTTLLAGDGGDELFGGNSRYAKQRIFGWYQAVPAPVRRALLEPALATGAARRLSLTRKAASYVEQATVPMPDRLEMYNLLVHLTHARVFDPGFLGRVNVEAPLAQQRAVWQAARAHSAINRNLAFDWKFTLADNDLPKVVGTTGMASMAVRFPLLADELVDFSLTVPPHYKLKGLKLRWFFKEALRGFLPDEILTKKKHGFGLPFGHWVLKDPALGKLVDDSLGGIATRGILRPGFVRELKHELLPKAPGYYGEMVWVLMMLEQWLRGWEDKGSSSGTSNVTSNKAKPPVTSARAQACTPGR
jgi:asparagine synthase (glutamine-hydrolysing)